MIVPIPLRSGVPSGTLHSMKLAVLLLFAVVAFAQVPAHSVVGALTIDVVDIQVPVAYGTIETKAVISVCSSQQVNRIQLNIFAADSTGASIASATHDAATTQVEGAYCVSAVASVGRSTLTELYAYATTQAHILVPLPPPPAAYRRKYGSPTALATGSAVRV